MSSQISVLMSRALMTRLQTYLYLSWGDLPVFFPKQVDDRRYPWDLTIFHKALMANPAQSTLSEQRVHCGEAGTGKNLNIGRFVPRALAWHRLSRFHFLSGGCTRYTLLS